eukprot:4076205-Amphidinium_carterae.1
MPQELSEDPLQLPGLPGQELTELRTSASASASTEPSASTRVVDTIPRGTGYRLPGTPIQRAPVRHEGATQTEAGGE